MRLLMCIFAFVFGQPVSANDTAVLTDLADLKWMNRLIIVNQVANEEEAIRLLQAHQEGIDERHILWFIMGKNDTVTNYQGKLANKFAIRARQQYAFNPKEVILIGKDGEIKSRLTRMDLTALFNQIDAMPMRRREMLQSK